MHEILDNVRVYVAPDSYVAVVVALDNGWRSRLPDAQGNVPVRSGQLGHLLAPSTKGWKRLRSSLCANPGQPGQALPIRKLLSGKDNLKGDSVK